MSKNKSIEILAPCGSYESVEAAVRQGADAVYIGSLQFSARAYAANFNEEQLKRAVRYCHLHHVKVHMAINTLISDEELSLALDTARSAYIIGVDAFIVQDLGLASLIKEACPDAVLHASTQLTVHTPAAANLLKSLGFERVVLSREMSKSEIEEVVRNTTAETEVFVHGALCMSVSGQCYLSAMIGGRSGNRGRCAQPCRLPFGVKNGTGFDLSLKDNCVAAKLSELCEMGVTSAKIEGRMKRPEYVAAATAAYRHTADNGIADNAELDRLKAVFSRSGFTDGYYTGKLGREMFGTRSKKDVVSATEQVLSDIRGEYKDEIQTNKVDFSLTICDGSPALLTAASRGYTVCVDGAVPEYARKLPLSIDKASAQLAKTGGTAFRAEKIDVQIDEGLTLPISAINNMRREALTQLEELIAAAPDRKTFSVKPNTFKPDRKVKAVKYRASFRHCNIPNCFKECQLVYVPLFSDINELTRLIHDGFNIAVELPRVFFGMEEQVRNALAGVKKIGISHAYCGNAGAVAVACEAGFTVHGGFGLNVFNSKAARLYKSIGVADIELSFELTAKQINSMVVDAETGIVGYGYLPLMITRNCPNKNGDGCAKCGGKSTITDRMGNSFALMCMNGCTELFNCKPLLISDKQECFKSIDFISLRFTHESNSECEKIFNNYKEKKAPKGAYTGGLYFRGVE